jgi:pilus assembly protein CpaE
VTNNQPIKVFLNEPNVKILTRLKEQFAGLERYRLVGTSSRGAQALAVIQDVREGVDVVVVDLDAPDGLDTVKRLAGLVPAIVGASLPGLPESISEQATAAGVTRFTTKPFSAKELLADIREAHRHARGSQETESLLGADLEIGRLVLVIAAKGGVGTSLVALNLAVGFRQTLQKTVTLIDADLQFGDQALLCASKAGPNITDLFDGHRQYTAKDLPAVLREGPAKIRLLAAPDNSRHADLVTPERFSSLLTDFRRFSNIVIIDCPSHLTDIILSALERADDIVVVSDLTESSIHTTKSLLATLAAMAIAPEKLHLVLNDARHSEEVSRETAQSRLGLAQTTSLPYDPKTVQTATKNGLPLLLSAKKSPLANSLLGLVNRLAASSPEAPLPPSQATLPDPKESAKHGRRLFSNRSKQS